MNFSKRRIKMNNLKPSGIEWIGSIPVDWKTVPIYYVAEEVTTKNKTLLRKNAFKFFFGNIINKPNFNPDEDNYVNKTIRNYIIVNPGDIVINGLNLNFDFVTKRVGMVTRPGTITSAYISLRPKANVILPKYMLYILRTYDSEKAFHNMGGGVRKILNYDELSKSKIILPSISAQTRIIKFLDKKVSQIDDISKKIQQEITDLEKYRKSIITKAVTKGLNPNVPMKDSGIPWIGKMPENWKLERVKLITTSLNKGISPNYIIAKGTPIITQAMFSQGYLNFHNIKYGSDPFELNQKGQVKSEDILFATTGGGVLGKVFFVDQIEKGYLASADVCIIRTNNKVFSSKLLYYIFSINYNLFNGLMATGSTNQIHLNMFQFKNMHIPVMPKTDQKKILKFIDQKASKINKLIDKKHKILDFLNQYKQSIIYEYVTGKKQVPTEEGAKE